MPNRDTLEVLLKLLDKVRSYCEPISLDNKQTVGGNKMDSFNLAMVFGPNLLKKHKLSQICLNTKSNDLATDKYNLIDDIDSVISVTKYLIENQNSIFSIDACLHNELIQTINNVSPSEVNSILARKIVSSIGVTLLETYNSPLADNNSDSSGYSSINAKSIESSSIYELDRVLHQTKQSLLKPSRKTLENIDFIDNAKVRTSRTKLHKITNNLTYNETINLVNSPSHSPIRQVQQTKSGKHRVSAPFSYTENQNHHQGSSLLLMIQTQANQRQPKIHKQASIGPNEHNLNENRTMSKSARSLSNLNVLSDYNRTFQHQQLAPEQHNVYKVNVNANRLQICSKFFDKTKFNSIGEQETLV